MEECHAFGQWSKSSEDLLKSRFPLHRACQEGDLETLTNILSAGEVDFYEEDDLYGWTPIHWAAYFGKLECVRTLCSNCQDLCEVPTSRFGRTPLHLASYMGHPHCIQWMIQTGANVEIKDYLGEMPVHKAARTGSMECVSLLVSQGCKLSVKNYNGQTPSQLAAECGFQECANYLERASQIQQQATPTNQQPVTTTTVLDSGHQSSSSEGAEEYVITQGINGGLIPNSQTKNVNTHIGVQDGLSYFDDNDCDMDTSEKMEGAVGGACNNEVTLSRSGIKRCLEDLSKDSTKKMRTGESSKDEVNPIVNSYLAILSVSTEPLSCTDFSSDLPCPSNKGYSVFM